MVMGEKEENRTQLLVAIDLMLLLIHLGGAWGLKAICEFAKNPTPPCLLGTLQTLVLIERAHPCEQLSLPKRPVK